MSKPIEILRFLKLADGSKAMRIRGEIYHTVSDIPDERVQKIIRRTIADMVDMAGGLEQLVDEGLIERPITQHVEPAQTGQPTPDKAPDIIKAEIRNEQPEVNIDSNIDEVKEAPSADAREAFLESLRNQTLEPEADDPPGRENSFLGRLRGLTARQPEEVEELLPKLDMAGQIDSILQAKLNKMPAFSGRHIQLRSKLGGELAFIVDGSSYESVNDIPDEDVKAVFRKSITEWESRNL